MSEPKPTLLPLDLVHQILSWVDTAFFTFLDALGTADARGPYEPLWQLSLHHDHSFLWPSLRLDCLYDAPSDLLDAVVPLYMHLELSGVDDPAWLLDNVALDAKIKWNAPPLSPHDVFGPLEEWYAAWAELPLTHITVYGDYCNSPGPFVAVLPRLYALTCLDLTECSFFECVDAVFAYAAESRSLISLTLAPTLDYNRGFEDLTPHHLECLLLWFDHQPVVHLDLDHLKWTTAFSDAPTLASCVCSAVFNCPTLNTLHFTSFVAADLGRIQAPLNMEVLDLDGLSASSVSQLATAINGSNVKTLILSAIDIANYNGWLHALAQSSVICVDFTACSFQNVSWPLGSTTYNIGESGLEVTQTVRYASCTARGSVALQTFGEHPKAIHLEFIRAQQGVLVQVDVTLE
ncbi:Aste57867_498 [Aphanomyces stellatus]|uniref:Aste57867_498 protein n=1 Tax=Aphanomyces stellatus TaxID=120398 RepID=A0A485K7S2_9STRA|nr:hypothetical protein As57867_000497 [Aphanomyces stellatus]VFT77723.1 Aste57867_498 [Aphanomyces stellatus]